MALASTRSFPLDSDPAHLWPGPPYEEALATLRAGVLGNAGLLLLTGDSAIGKTIVVNALANRLVEDGVLVARPPSPWADEMTFLRGVATACGLFGSFATSTVFLARFSHLLRDVFARRRRVLLAIDDAHDLPPALFAEIARLAEVAREAGRGYGGTLNILLAGRSELNALLTGAVPTDLARDIKVRCHLRPLTESETGDFIAHQLERGGSEREVFTSDAVHEVWAFSGGAPGLINLVSGRALVAASRRGAIAVDGDVLRQCAAELDGVTTKLQPEAQHRVAPTAPRARPAFRMTHILRRALVIAGVVAAAGMAGAVVRHLAFPWRAGDAKPVTAPGRAQVKPRPGPADTPAIVKPATSGPPPAAITPSAPTLPVLATPDPAAAPSAPRAGGPSPPALPAVTPPAPPAITPPAPAPPPVAPSRSVTTSAPTVPPSPATRRPPVAVVPDDASRRPPERTAAEPTSRIEQPPAREKPTVPSDDAAKMTRRESPRRPATRGEPEPDPGDLIDWVLKRSPTFRGEAADAERER